MFRYTLIASGLALAFASPLSASAADASEMQKIRAEIQQMKDSYETRIQALEKRLQDAEAKTEKIQVQAQQPQAGPSQPVATPSTASANAFNPAIALILGGTYANLSQDPNKYRVQGFIPGGGDIGPGKRSFNLGESELTFSANIDPQFAGLLTFAVTPDNSVSVEEAFFQSKGLSNGFGVKGGRFLSSIGYLNIQHAHAWDFVDTPLAYQAFLDGAYKNEGVQATWLAPTERFFEVGLEAGRSATFPGNERNKNGFGSSALFAHIGDDIGESASWRAGLSYLRNAASDRSYQDIDTTGAAVTNAFSGRSGTWIADAIYKFAPNGNSTRTNFKLQGEYFRRSEKGSLTYDTQAVSLGTSMNSYTSAQSGWYLQGVYQFMPRWRTGLRYDKLNSGTPNIGLPAGSVVASADFSKLTPYNPTRSTLMFDYSPSEFSRFRVQFARDKAQPGAADNQIFLQYIMSLGAHGGHKF